MTMIPDYNDPSRRRVTPFGDAHRALGVGFSMGDCDGLILTEGYTECDGQTYLPFTSRPVFRIVGLYEEKQAGECWRDGQKTLTIGHANQLGVPAFEVRTLNRDGHRTEFLFKLTWLNQIMGGGRLAAEHLNVPVTIAEIGDLELQLRGYRPGTATYKRRYAYMVAAVKADKERAANNSSRAIL